MLTTGRFVVHFVRIPFRNFGEPIYLIPFGDMHRFARNCHEEKWFEWIEWAKRKERCYFLGMGDYDDLASASERDILSNPKLHDETKNTIDAIFRGRTEKLAKELSFMGDRLIGLLNGNHYGVLPSGITTDELLCEKLQTKFLGANCFLRLSFDMVGAKHESTRAIDIFAHHGRGAARTGGGSLRSVEQMADVATADIYLMGHDHQKTAYLKSKLELPAAGKVLRLHDRKILFARTGSFLTGYKENVGSYVVDKLLPPSDLGTIKIELTPRRSQAAKQDELYIDIHASI
jgi:hypothetical protein